MQLDNRLSRKRGRRRKVQREAVVECLATLIAKAALCRHARLWQAAEHGASYALRVIARDPHNAHATGSWWCRRGNNRVTDVIHPLMKPQLDEVC
jgi:hypothetical protein